jgi:phosphonate transport system permease protein
MTNYPDGIVKDPPKWLTPQGLLDIVTPVLQGMGQRLGVVFLDLLAVGVVWILVSYTVNWHSRGEISYTLAPWWLFGLVTVELAALWESFGHSLGFKVARRELVGPGGAPPTPGQRVRYFLGWHFTVLPLVGLVFQRPWHERWAGLSPQPISLEGRIPPPWWRTSVGIYVAVFLVVGLAAATSTTVDEESLNRLFTQAWRTVKFWRALFSPDQSIILPSIRDLLVTIFMAVMATSFAVVVAVPLSFLAARNLMRGPLGRLIYTTLRGALSIMRSIEPIVWAIIFLVWVTARRAPFAGVLALWVHSIADLTKLYAERLESIDPGLIEAITATGANRLQVLRYAVVPQIINPYISFTLYRWDINIRMATVVGVVGGGGIGQRLFFYLKNLAWQQAGTVMILIVILVWAIDYLSARLRAKLA